MPDLAPRPATAMPATGLEGPSRVAPCPHCGGSGTLRLGSQRSRTCLPCLGQGRTIPLGAAITTAQLASLRAAARLNAWVSRAPAG